MSSLKLLSTVAAACVFLAASAIPAEARTGRPNVTITTTSTTTAPVSPR